MQFVRQSRAIKVMNLDGKLQTDKKTRKHGNILLLYALSFVDCQLRQERADKSACWKVCIVYSISYTYIRNRCNSRNIDIANLLASIEEISYFTISNNSVILLNEALPNSIFIFDDVACNKQDAIREYFARTTCGYRLLLFLSDVRKDTKASYMRQFIC